MRADGVFSGGGVKGIAFAGALQAAAEAGYDEWVSLAGTSAGAITAMALAVGYDAAGIRDELDRFDFSTLADYGSPRVIEEPLNLARLNGATKGQALTKWIEGLLARAPQPATTFGELRRELRVVGVDLAHTRVVVFPEDVSLYVDSDGHSFDPAAFSIATAVRISAGYPYFFPPLGLRDAVTGKQGVLVDGGVSSSYPVFLFDKPEPQHPTWGFRLFDGNPPEPPSYTAIEGNLWPIDMLEAIVATAMNAFDKLEEQAFGPRTIAIPTGTIPTLEFNLTDAQKQELYDFGYRAGKAFFDRKPDGVNTYGRVPASLAGAA
jgi:NTE family protein